MLRSFFTLLAFLTVFSAHQALAYDLEDYATTEQATFDALVKANNEFVQAGPPHQSALEAYRAGVLEYSSSIKISSPSGDLKEKNILNQK